MRSPRVRWNEAGGPTLGTEITPKGPAKGGTGGGMLCKARQRENRGVSLEPSGQSAIHMLPYKHFILKCSKGIAEQGLQCLTELRDTL